MHKISSMIYEVFRVIIRVWQKRAWLNQIINPGFDNFMYRERGIRVVREAWLIDSIEKQEAQPLEAYDLVTDLAADSKGIPWDKMDPSEEALESIAAEVCFSFHLCSSYILTRILHRSHINPAIFVAAQVVWEKRGLQGY